MKRSLSLFLLTAIAILPESRAAEPVADKSGFTLSIPTPRALMREMSTDRPDKTECPFTVDAGHVQVELDWAVYGEDHDTAHGADTRVTSWAIVPVNIKVGLTNSDDVQFVIEPINRVHTEGSCYLANLIDQISGFDDVTVRYKHNFWGNDGGESAFGLMPFVKLPTNQHDLGNHSVEGGVIVPYNRGLAGGWEAGMQTEVDVVRNDGREGYHTEWVNSLTFGHELGGKFGAYAELFSQHSAESGAHWIGTADFGITYAATADIQFDAGINFGISAAAPDVEIFTGISFRY